MRLFCAWMFLQSFYYKAIPLLSWTAGITFTPDRVIFLVMVIAFAIRWARRSRPPNRLPGTLFVNRSAAVFVLVAIISWIVNESMVAQARSGTLTWVLNIGLFPALAFFIASRLEFTKELVTELLWFFALFGGYLSVTAFAEHFNVSALVHPKYILDQTVGIHFGRSRGPFVDTISNGGMLLVAFLACAGLSAAARGLKRHVAIVLMIIVVPAIYFTETRAVWLGLGAIVLTFSALQTRLRRAGVVIAGLLLVAFSLGIGSKFSAFDRTLFSRRQNTIDYRIDNYRLDWKAFSLHPIVGIGWGNLLGQWRDFADATMTFDDRDGLDGGNHSTMLGLLAELGLIGAVPFVGMVVGGALICLAAYRELRDRPHVFERDVAILALAALESMVVLSLTNDLKAMPVVNVSAFWFVGMIGSLRPEPVASEQLAHDARVPPLRTARRPPAALAGR